MPSALHLESFPAGGGPARACGRPGEHARHEADFARFAAFVEGTIGVRLPPGKRTMVEGRLRRRMNELGLADLEAYLDHLFRGGALEHERTAIFDAVTTNKTDFFREPSHFAHMMAQALPAAFARRHGTGQPVKLWSAAASTGAEAWTIAMCLAAHAEETGDFSWAILATDVNTAVLATACRAIYPEQAVAPVRAEYRRRWMMQGRDGQRGQWRIVPELRRRVRFAQLNLMETDYGIDRDIDVIFLRNVLIYFSPEEQARIVDRVAGHLVPGGILYLGHSESMLAHRRDLIQIAPATFARAE